MACVEVENAARASFAPQNSLYQKVALSRYEQNIPVNLQSSTEHIKPALSPILGHLYAQAAVRFASLCDQPQSPPQPYCIESPTGTNPMP